MPRLRTLRPTALVLLLAAVSLPTACSKRSSGTSLPGTTGYELCAAEMEAEYVRTLGNGTIRVVEDTRIPGPAIAFVQNGQRFVVVNPNDFGRRTLEFQELILAHEIGHHYLGGPPNRNSEYRADAFAVRAIVTLDQNAQAVEAALAQIELAPRPGNSDHPPDLDRVAYMRRVYRALLDGQECAPEAPE